MLQQPSRLRYAFTLAEMLTVLAIILLLMTLVLGGVSYVGTWQMKRQTEQTMLKALGHLDRWIEKIRANAERPLNTPSYNAIKQTALLYAVENQAGFQERATVLRFKLLYKLRMPMEISELQTAATNVLGSGDGDPDMKAINSYNPASSPPVESSRCLALILLHLARGDFSEKEIDPVSVQLLDAWGNPIRFYRYGYLALSHYPNLPVIAQEHLGTMPGSKDPLDPAGVLKADGSFNWWTITTGQLPPKDTNGSWHYDEFKYPYYPKPPTGPPTDYLPLLLASNGPDQNPFTSDDILSYTLRSVAGGR